MVHFPVHTQTGMCHFLGLVALYVTSTLCAKSKGTWREESYVYETKSRTAEHKGGSGITESIERGHVVN